MLRFFAASFITSALALERVRSSLLIEISFGGELNAGAELKLALDELDIELRRLPLSSTLRSQVDRLRKSMGQGADNRYLAAVVGEIEASIQGELAEWLFLGVQPNKREFCMDPGRRFGEAVLDAYPDSETDLKAAARCIGLDEWTASVFHLMRGIETALHAWAKQLELGLKVPITEANMQDILNAADKKLKAIEQQPKTEQRAKDLEYFGETSAHFRAIKNEWRNHVAHGKKTYDEREAIEIFQHVTTFMRKLGEKP